MTMTYVPAKDKKEVEIRKHLRETREAKKYIRTRNGKEIKYIGFVLL